jgi:hypothetical protein
MSALTKSLIALACVYGGALLGMFCRGRLPNEYQASESKEVVRLVMGLVVTTVAMALGLLVGSAKSFYDTQNAEIAQLASNYIMLDRILDDYGPESSDARSALRAVLADRLGESGLLKTSHTYMELRSGAQVGSTLRQKIQALSPKDDDQKFLKDEAVKMEIQLGQTRWLMFAQDTIPFPRMLLVMLITWLVLLFVSFGIFAPRNPLVLTGLFASALVVCGAILLILEMYNPQRGLIRASDAPLRAAFDLIGR